MNPLTNMKNVLKLSEAELKGRNKTSWHDQYRGSAWIFVGGLPYDLTEGDVVCVFSQYGEPVNINLVRDKDTGKSKGFCFICYEDQRSTDLAVDNLNGIKLLGRTLRVDHVNDYRPPRERKDDDEDTKILKREGLAGVSVRNNEKEKTSTVKVEPTKEKSGKKKNKVVEKIVSESETSSDSEKAKRKKKRKKEKPDVKRRKNRKKESSSSSSESESSESSDDHTPHKKRKKNDSTSDSDSSQSSADEKQKKRRKHKSSERQDQGKKGVKHSKTIEELKQEARLIQEELLRRQKAKEEKEGSSSKKKQEKHHNHEADDTERRHSNKREDRHKNEGRLTDEQKQKSQDRRGPSSNSYRRNVEDDKRNNHRQKKRDSSGESSSNSDSYPDRDSRPQRNYPKPTTITRRLSRSPDRHRTQKTFEDRVRHRSRSNDRQFKRQRSPQPQPYNHYRGDYNGRGGRFDNARGHDRSRVSPRRYRR